MATNQTYYYTLPVDSNQSVTLHFQGNVNNATLRIGGNVIDKVIIGGETSGRLNFLNGQPIHRALACYNSCKVDFESTDPSPPVITEELAANNLTWGDINDNIYFENIVLSGLDIVRRNNVMMYSRNGLCALRHCS